MLKIIEVKFENGDQYENIIEYKCVNLETSKMSIFSRAGLIDYINKNSQDVFVQDDRGFVEVFVIDAKSPYLRTKKDNRETDNLLHLPTFK